MPKGLSRLFVDGVNVRTFPSPEVSNQGDNTRLARQFMTAEEYHNGLIDDLLIFNTALSADEIALLANRCPGDVDENSLVDAVDLAIVLSRWGDAPKDYPRADANRDGVIDAVDLATVLGSWGSCP